MGFLDNLENSLNSLERSNERDDGAEQRRREADRAEALAIGPFAGELKSGPFAMALMDHATRIGWSQRTKVTLTWLGPALSLGAREKRLELRPTAHGVRAIFFENGEETDSELVDMKLDASSLAERWLHFSATP
ncbi:MAG: hypothetical protein WKF37_06860 [Bryobacteraceae bacterium]